MHFRGPVKDLARKVRLHLNRNGTSIGSYNRRD